jgi:peptide chain release factor
VSKNFVRIRKEHRIFVEERKYQHFGMNMFGVSPEKEIALTERLNELGIRQEDLVEKFIRSGGHGGQNVNKVSTCVYLKHIPTGTEVKCQKERSQALNRYHARKMLADKIENLIKGKESAEQQRNEKIRRQKRRRSRRAKEKMLANKHHQSDKKKERRVVVDPE